MHHSQLKEQIINRGFSLTIENLHQFQTGQIKFVILKQDGVLDSKLYNAVEIYRSNERFITKFGMVTMAHTYERIKELYNEEKDEMTAFNTEDIFIDETNSHLSLKDLSFIPKCLVLLIRDIHTIFPLVRFQRHKNRSHSI